MRFHVNTGEPDRVHITCALECVKFIVHHPAILETEAVLSVDRSAWTGWDESLRGVQERREMFHLRLVVWLFDYRQLSISGACKCFIRVHLDPFEVVLHAVSIAGVAQQVAIHHCLIYGVVDMGFVVRPSFGKVHVTRTEDVPFANVDG